MLQPKQKTTRHGKMMEVCVVAKRTKVLTFQYFFPSSNTLEMYIYRYIPLKLAVYYLPKAQLFFFYFSFSLSIENRDKNPFRRRNVEMDNVWLVECE